MLGIFTKNNGINDFAIKKLGGIEIYLKKG